MGFDDAQAHPLFARIVSAWSDESTESAPAGVARDVALIHVASMSNMFAALGWALIDLLEHPTYADTIVAGDREVADELRPGVDSPRTALTDGPLRHRRSQLRHG